MTESPVLVLGAGGHARVICALLARAGRSVAGVLDREAPRAGESILGHAVVGSFADLAAWHRRGVRHVALALGDNAERQAMAARAADEGFEAVGLRHPTAIVEPGARVAASAVLCAQAFIGADARVGAHALVNSGASADHECDVGEFVHLAPGSVLAGRVRVGRGAFVGAGAVVREKIRIGEGAIVGAAACVVCDVDAGTMVLGVPARRHAAGRSSWPFHGAGA